jgi:hypothetical protein
LAYNKVILYLLLINKGNFERFIPSFTFSKWLYSGKHDNDGVGYAVNLNIVAFTGIHI